MAGYGATDEGLATWLAARGYVLPADAPSPAILLTRATDYLDSTYGSRLSCWDQDAAFTIAVGRAVYAAAWHEAVNPGSLTATATAAGAVKRERVEGAVDVEYFQGSGNVLADATVKLSAVEGILAPYIQPIPAIFVV